VKSLLRALALGLTALALMVGVLPQAAHAATRVRSGRVTDEAGHPIAGFTVEAVDVLTCGLGHGMSPCSKPVLSVTDADGRYQVESVANSVLYAAAGETGYISTYYTCNGKDGTNPYDTVGCYTGSSAPDSYDFKLHVGGKITGKLTDHAGNPVAGAEVSNSSMHGTGVTTDSDGVFQIVGLPAGEYGLHAFKDGYLDTTKAGSIAVAEKAVITGADFAIDQGSLVSGTIVDPDGNPVDNAWLCSASGCFAWAHDGGKFSTRLAAGTYTAWAKGDGFSDSDAVTGTLTEGVDQSGLVFRLAKAASLTVATTFADGVTRSQAITVKATGREERAWPTDGKPVSFTLAADSYTVEVSVEGFAKATKTVTLAPGESKTVSFTFGEATPAATVSGRVTDWQGNPVAHAKVCVSTTECVATTDATGAYSVRQPVGTYTAWAVSGALTSGKVTGEVVDGQNLTGVDFQLAKPADSKLTAATPSILGLVKVGKKLTVRAGSWGPAPVKLSYRWYANGKAIKGATKSSYKVVKSLKGKKITVKVTGSKAGYVTVTKASKATKKVVR
jgi:protocatechuate 3,4-dioxygenase beta subunit